jgi:ribosomal protein S18 acetylase RimI-like enzyme
MIEDGLYLTPIGEDVDAYVALELEAAGPLARFVFRDMAVARDVHGALVRAGQGEQAPPHGRLLRDAAGLAVAMYTGPFTRGLLAQARLLGARALSRVEAFRADPEIRNRMTATRELFVVPEEGDAYLSRIAIAGHARGRGFGGKVFARFRAECEAASARRIVLEVASEHEQARAFYARLGFRDLAARSIEVAGVTLAYSHLGLDL